MEYALLFVVAFLTVFFYLRSRRKQRLPPGPRGIPFIGNAFQMDHNNPLPALGKWTKEFGEIFKITLMGQDIVVVSSLDLARDVLLKKQETFSGRPAMVKVKAYMDFKEDVGVSSSSPTWKIKRKALFSSLKMYGQELQKLEMITLEGIQDTIKQIEELERKPFNPADQIHQLIVDFLAILTYGGKLPADTAKDLMETQEIFQVRHLTNNGAELELMPWLRHFGHPVWKDIQQNKKKMMGIYKEMVAKRKEVLDVENPQCVIDGLLVAQINEAKENNGTILDDQILSFLTFDLFEAGVLTTKRTTLAFIAIMANHPDLQEKLHGEIDRVIGSDQPRLQDRHQMHFTSACIPEVLRYISLSPFLLPHLASEDGELGSYFIPKGTQVWVNMEALNRDPKYWEDPWEFKPERFLDEQGHQVKPDHPNKRRSLAFGAGMRSCVGEVTGKSWIFLLVASLFQQFKFLPAEGEMAPNHDPRSYRFGISMIIKDYEIMAIPRSKGEY